MAEKIIIRSCASYEREIIKGFLEDVFRELDLNIAGSKVLLKPNLVVGKPPDKAVNTHPEIVAAVASLLSDHGCRVAIGDSPGYESPERALKSAGLTDIVRHYGLSVASFDGQIPKEHRGISPYRHFVLGEDPSLYDEIVNLPKLKSHAMLGMTLGVKNAFGFIHGMDKAKWHLRTGRDIALFASMLIDIFRLVSPGITILDGILGMDGDGPTHGRVRHFGILGAGRNAFALDRAIERMAGIAEPLPISAIAEREGFIGDYTLLAEDGAGISGFRMPKTVDPDWGLPVCFRDTLKRFFVRKPRATAALCTGCQICLQVCAAGAISAGEKMPVFDYAKCIRCYCCQEMCPQGAIRV